MIKFKKETVSDRFNDQLQIFLDLDIQVNGKYWLAGGALRHIFGCESPIDDFDLFFDNMITAAEVGLALEDKGFNCVFTCPLGELKTYKSFDHEGMKIQLITKNFYPDMKHVISLFDINACCIAYDGEFLVTTRSAIRDIKKKRVTLNDIVAPNATFKRMLKYQNKGYRVTSDAVDFFTRWVYDRGTTGDSMDVRFYID